MRLRRIKRRKTVTLAQTRLPDGGQAWLAKHAYIDLACEILQRLHYVPTMSRQGGPINETGIVTVTYKRYNNCELLHAGGQSKTELTSNYEHLFILYNSIYHCPWCLDLLP